MPDDSQSWRRYDRDQLTADQIAWVVRKRQRITAFLPGRTVSGYIFGQDRYHWAMITPDLETLIIPKVTPLLLEEEAAMSREPNAEALQARTAQFRAFVLATHFHMRQRSDSDSDN